MKKSFILLLTMTGILLGVKLILAQAVTQYSCKCIDPPMYQTNDCVECTLKCANQVGVDACEPIANNAPPSSNKGSSGGGNVSLPNWLNMKDAPAGEEVQYLIGRVIKVMMGLVGSIALLMFFYGGLLWMTAAGNEDKITQGKNIFIWASAGILVIFTSYILVYFVISNLLTLGK